MNLREPIAIAVFQLWANKVRTLLTILGILIGVGSVVGTVSIGEGMRHAVIGELDRLGGNRLVLVFNPTPWVREGNRWARRPWEDYLINADIERIRRGARHVQNAFPLIFAGADLAYDKASISGELRGTDITYGRAMGWDLARGRFLVPRDLSDRKRVCVIGDTIRRDLFGELDPIGRYLQLNGERYRVVGVMVEKRMFGEDWGTQVVVPYTTVQARILGRQRLSALFVHASSVSDTRTVVTEVKRILRRYHEHGEEFQVEDVGQNVQQAEQIFFILKAVVGGIAGISLLVGGIGVMNIMLVSVTERTREIGIRKAIGARPSDILTQFLVEAVVLSLFGGLVGLLLGLLLGQGGAAAIRKASGGEFLSIVSMQAIWLALGFSAAVGIFFGVYPAMRAARLDPVEALRYE